MKKIEKWYTHTDTHTMTQIYTNIHSDTYTHNDYTLTHTDSH